MTACNADGSESLDLFFIGKSAKPRCFDKKTPRQLGLWYESNVSAWMTRDLAIKCVIPLSRVLAC